MTKRFSLYCLDEGLVDYFVGEDSISTDHTKKYFACKLFLQKHPEIITKYPIMAKRMSDNLFAAAVSAKKNKQKGVGKCIGLAIKCSKTPKALIKSFAVITGLYTLH